MGQATLAFRDLLAPVDGLDPAQVQRRAGRLLPDQVRATALGWWSPDRPVPPGDPVLLVGVAVWSGYDMRLLDHMAAVVGHGPLSDVAVYVFDSDEFQSQEQVDAVFPGIGLIHHTPIVGLWQHRRLTEAACGYHGRLIVARVLGLDPEPLHQRVVSTPNPT